MSDTGGGTSDAGGGSDATPSSRVLTVEDLTVAFGRGRRGRDATPVLHGVSLHVDAGECVAVVGESGAGKSVLSRALLGLAGEGGSRAHVAAARLELAGQDVRGAGQRRWRRLRGRRVGLVMQDALGSLDPLRTIGAEVAETLDAHGGRTLPRARRREAVLTALADAGLDDPALRASQRSGDLSGGMRQRALIASAIVGSPDLLVLDEPTTALDATVASGVLALLARLRDSGSAMVLVSHDLRAVARVADRVVVLRDGLVVEEGPTARVLSSPSHPYTRRLVDAVPRGPKSRSAARATAEAPPSGPPALEATGVSRTYGLPGGGVVRAVDDVSVTLLPGRALGVVGESGSGKSTLARLLLAAERPDAGEVTLGGEPWSALTERARRPLRRRVRLVPQDPLASVDPRLDVAAVLRDAARSAGRRPGDGAALLAQVLLGPEILARRPRTLSGGQRQRVAIARALAADPDVLVCDEPVSALDVTVQAEILALLLRLQAERGLSLVLISHDLAVVRQVCDDVVVMKDGAVVERGEVEAVWAAPAHPFTRALLEAGT
ncbi:ATP-binding cassette domain-containing protein [Litorihabitans aurantiacus]|uniref:ABC transporter ATP-binding protein n=1 Tax=Litorihabitans aurantiacus TaxID=1930061 RepID=A0AA37UWT8_9MICO|nr:ABC transporter ATP-binding protein [Litorihabitans aurantiacus]GMA30787.1 ABC transporter ATP-binding protein [Litorihabitans aurantiacus]